MARMGNKTIQDAQKAINKTDDELNTAESDIDALEAVLIGNYTVATLPAAGTEGRIAYATDALKASETTGNGTGNLVFDDGSNWIRVDTGATAGA